MATLTKTNTGIYEVKPGDSLYKIASQTGRTLNDLIKYNPSITNPNLIHPGQKINLGGQAPTITQTPQGTQVGNSFYQNFGNYSSAYPSNPQTNTQTNTQTNNGGYDYSSLIAGSNTGSNTNYQPTNSSQTQSSGFAEALRDMLLRAQKINREGQDALEGQSNTITQMGLSDAERIFKDPGFNPTDGTLLGMSAQKALNPLNMSIAGQQASAERNLGNFTDLVRDTAKTYNEFGGSYGEGSVLVDSWVDNINLGKAKISDVPKELKNSVIERLAEVLDPATTNLVKAATFVVRDATRAIEGLEQIEKRWLSDTGVAGAWRGLTTWSPLFGKNPYEIAQMIQSVKDNIGIDALLNIKREGSGLGQVPQKQLESLQGLLGRLNIKREPSELKKDIQDVLDLYQLIADNATSKVSERGTSGGSSGVGTGLFQEVW
jgi:hypothetical protein